MKHYLVHGAAIAALLATPVRAEDAPDPNAATIAHTAELNAQKDLVNAETGLFKAKFDALGLPTVDGKVTAGEQAGLMETQMLSAGAVAQAATKIAAVVDGHADSRPVIILGPSEKLDLTVGASIQNRMNTLAQKAKEFKAKGCKVGPWFDLPKESEADEQSNDNFTFDFRVPGGALPLAAVGEVLKVLRVDTDIQALTFSETERILVNGLASKVKNARLPGEIVQLNPNSALVSSWISLGDLSQELSGCSQTINKALAARKLEHGEATGRNAVIEAEAKARADAMSEQAKAIEAYRNAVNTPGETGQTPLAAAEGIADLAKQNPLVLRAAVEHSGGTRVKRTHIGTAFGAYGINLTGGLVVSYRLVDPTTGTPRLAGVAVCRTGLASLQDVHKGKVKAAENACDLMPTAP